MASGGEGQVADAGDAFLARVPARFVRAAPRPGWEKATVSITRITGLPGGEDLLTRADASSRGGGRPVQSMVRC